MAKAPPVELEVGGHGVTVTNPNVAKQAGEPKRVAPSLAKKQA